MRARSSIFILSIFHSIIFFSHAYKTLFPLSRCFYTYFFYLSHVVFVMFLLLYLSVYWCMHIDCMHLIYFTRYDVIYYSHCNTFNVFNVHSLQSVAYHTQYHLYLSNLFNMVSFITCIPHKFCLLHSGVYIHCTYTTYRIDTVNVRHSESQRRYKH